ncbi:response regulator transcription factor [Eisenbergiella sp.]
MVLLIVDDERSAVDAVLEGVNWEKLNYREVLKAYSSIEAKKQLQEHNVDVILCDIEMPKESGLELLGWIRENKPGICCIFMTCHADFSFAQKAVHLGSFEYILKPLDFRHLEEVLGKAFLKAEQDKRLKTASSNWEKNHKMVERQFWRSLFIGELPFSEAGISSCIERYQLDIPIHGSFLPILISPRRLPDKNRSQEDDRIIDFALRNVAEELFFIPGCGHKVEYMSEHKVLVILTLNGILREDQYGCAVKCCQNFIMAAKKYLHERCCCYIGETVSILEIPAQMENLHIMDMNNVILPWGILSAAERKREREKFETDFWTVNTVKDYYLQSIKEMPSDTKDMEQVYLDIYYFMDFFYNKNNIHPRDFIDTKQAWRLENEEGDRDEKLFKWIQLVIENIAVAESAHMSGSSPINNVREYVRSHINEELVMEDIARQVHLNCDYLNRLFKKEMGIPLSRYVIQQKIERAKWLLTHTDWKVGDIAASVGYYNYSSFYRIFTKIVGVSPQEYVGGKKEEKK